MCFGFTDDSICEPLVTDRRSIKNMTNGLSVILNRLWLAFSEQDPIGRFLI